MASVLIIDDEESICWGLASLCKQMSIDSQAASSAEKGLELASVTHFDVVIMDVRLPGIDGVSAIEKFHNLLGKVPVITITAFSDLKTTVDAFKTGAFEYITKPFELESVKTTIQQALAASRIIKETQTVDDAVESDTAQFAGFVGHSAIMQEVFKQIALTTTTDAPVLITGESGTGKELTARAIHNFSSRADKPFVPVNIAALTPTIAESELFGHVKGAFTGADSNREGLIQQAHGGTLFLDEIAEIPMEMQVKLLRVLDSGEVAPVGSNEFSKTDFRLISATHQDLLSQINYGEFRHDLFYRLRSLEIQLPSLRQRLDDMPALVNHFIAASKTVNNISVSDEFISALKARSWPGNVRELQFVVARAVTIARGGVLTAKHVDQGDKHPARKSETGDIDQAIVQLVRQWTRGNWNDGSGKKLYDRLIDVIEPPIMSEAYALSDHQYSAASRKLGIHRTTLKKKLDDLENQ